MKYLWESDNFDSEIFGFKVAKIKSLEKGATGDLIKDLKKNRIKYATFRIPSNNFALIHTLEKSGFILVDCLINLNLETSDIKTSKLPKEIRESNSADLDALKTLTSRLFSTGRVLNDPFIPKKRAKQFYVRWIENAVLGKSADLVLVWDEREILGYITLQKKGQISLVGVSAKARGRGIGKKLINASANRFSQWNVRNIIVETQADNIPALNFYQSAGFRIANSFLTLRWSENA